MNIQDRVLHINDACDVLGGGGGKRKDRIYVRLLILVVFSYLSVRQKDICYYFSLIVSKCADVL